MMIRERFASALRFAEFVRSAQANREMWEIMARRASPPEELFERVARVPGSWHLLVLVEDWCGDAVNTVPQIAALSEAAPNLDLRVVGRDVNPDLMNAHLTGGSRSIPIVIVLDESYREVAWWGPRPAPLQAWVSSEGQALSKEDRYREVRRWYARDRGLTTLHEIVAMVESAAAARQVA
jgi:hypothetical protein